MLPFAKLKYAAPAANKRQGPLAGADKQSLRWTLSQGMDQLEEAAVCWIQFLFIRHILLLIPESSARQDLLKVEAEQLISGFFPPTNTIPF